MYDKLVQNNIKVILIQIDEAHSSAWPAGLENQVEPQIDLNDRISRAKQFIENDQPPYPVYIDDWNNEYAEIYRAWPDKYYMVDNEYTILNKSTYGISGDMNAKIELDCVDLMTELTK